MLYIYNIGIHIYGLLLRLASLFVPKAKALVKGRSRSLEIIRSKKAEFPNEKWIWVHAASLGEFEQGRHLIDILAEKYSEYKIALSFYSPSGYVPRHNYKNVDMVFYLPLDTVGNANTLIKSLSPHLAIFIKYDFWWNHLNALQDSSIPTIFISAEIRTNQYFVKYHFGKIRTILEQIDHFYVQTQKSADLLRSIDIQHATVAGDSRLDSILNEEVAALPILNEIIEWKGDQKCIIYGSIHLSDIDVLNEMTSIEARHLIVPHDIDETNISSIKSQLPGAEIYSDSGLQDCSLVILDKLGVLRHIYGKADIVYIGGGFGNGIHNTLEPLVSLVPILIGPNYHKFPEAVFLTENYAIEVVDDPAKAKSVTQQLLLSSHTRTKCIQEQYISLHSGATNKIISSMLKNKWI